MDANNRDATHIGASWQLTRVLSPRPQVRVAATDAHGVVLNMYTGQQLIEGCEPTVPWAMYLADADGRFRLLCFDLDSKASGLRSQASHDAETIATLLADEGLPAVVCESGPSGGRHVWTAVGDGVDADTVATLARLIKHQCPTLDLAPLTNPATGCVRPPGSPHRDGGYSQIISGDPTDLATATGSSQQVCRLTESLAQSITTAEPSQTTGEVAPLPLDRHGRLYLPGPRRPLPLNSETALNEDAAAGDASAVLWTILIGAAAARWRYTDVAQLADHSPGFEHIRTYRDRAGRRPRSSLDATRILQRQWDKAVRYVATSPRQIGDDPTFDSRADAIAGHVQSIQETADAARGRWTRRGGAADRRVLDALCILALQAMQTVIEADIRRLALLTGIGRETARTALLRLASEGWISRQRDAAGARAACWDLAPDLDIHRGLIFGRSQAVPRPEGAGAAERLLLLHDLTSRQSSARHDTFTPAGLGLLAGNVYAHLSKTSEDAVVVARHTGLDYVDTVKLLTRLQGYGLLVQTPSGWSQPDVDHRDVAARRLAVDGVLDERARRYSIERELWAWWQAEQEWMTAPKRTPMRRRPARGQLVLIPDAASNAYGPHPRRADGRLDWREARHIVETERSGDTASTHHAAWLVRELAA